LLPFYEAMRALGLKHFLINDERCGAFASDAYARVTNRPGVCDATLGPGATNLVTALVESLNAGIPQVAIIGDANRDHAWKNMTQEARQTEILKPAVKELIRVEGTKRIPELVRRAFAVATSGRPGPVVLDVPEDVCHGEHEFDAADFWVDDATLKAQARRTRPDPQELERAAKIIAKAERPLLLVGGGIHISEAYDALLALAENFGIPVAHTMSGKGAIACSHPLSGRAVRTLFAHRQRSGRRLRRADCGRLQARRDPDAPLSADPAGKTADPHRYPSRGDRPHHAHRCGAGGGRAARIARSRGRDERRRYCAGEAPALVRRGAVAHEGVGGGRCREAPVGREADQRRPPDG
jgi:thiamine pyrophosphate-dependent acetolactate synthase large subunit-like protein